jgi:uncharacterized oligopeptide transporter (OPT) family protein
MKFLLRDYPRNAGICLLLGLPGGPFAVFIGLLLGWRVLAALLLGTALWGPPAPDHTAGSPGAAWYAPTDGLSKGDREMLQSPGR